MVLFWSSLGSLAMASVGLYTLAGHQQQEVIRAGREIPDHVNEDTANNVSATLDNTEIISSRIFEGTREWLVSTLISVLGVFATAIIIKVSVCHCYNYQGDSTSEYDYCVSLNEESFAGSSIHSSRQSMFAQLHSDSDQLRPCDNPQQCHIHGSWSGVARPCWCHFGPPDYHCCSPGDRKSTRLNSSHSQQSRMPSSA